ncbi:MAG: ATP-binding protein [Pyrinomonadaceae bacterium]
MPVLNETFFTATTLPPEPEFLEESDRRILIVDDEEPIRSLFEQCLNERYSCATATNVDEALTYLSQEPFALVISDMLMPGRSGVELLREVTQRFPDTAFVMASGVDRTQRVLDAVRLGAYDYLLKPCDLDVLELCVERALERRRLLRDGRLYKKALERRNAELAQRKAALERLQAQMVHSEKMASLGQLAAGVAHELNNPAGFIYGNMEILRDCAAGFERLLRVYEQVPLPASLAPEISRIKSEIDYENSLADLLSIVADCHNGAERIRDVVQNLRLFSRLDEAEFKMVDVHESIDSTLRLLSQYYGADRTVIERHYGELPPIACYAGQLNQVLMNLLVNAAQAAGCDGRVRVTTASENEHVSITISDSGAGILAENLSKIFDPFFTTKPVGEGTGLGLSISHSIIERQGGTISVKSPPGEGATFTIVLPVNAKSSTA